MIVVQLTVHAWRGTVIVTAMTTAPVPWFVETTTVLGMDLMALMIVVQVNLFYNNDSFFMQLQTKRGRHFLGRLNWPLFVGSFHNHSDLCFQNQESKVLHLQTVMSECSPCTHSWKKWEPRNLVPPFFSSDQIPKKILKSQICCED